VFLGGGARLATAGKARLAGDRGGRPCEKEADVCFDARVASVCPNASVEGIADGVRTAHSIEKYLKTGRMDGVPETFRQTRSEIVMTLPPSLLAREEKTGDLAVDVIAEARRCLLCDCRLCRDACELFDAFGRMPRQIVGEAIASLHAGDFAVTRQQTTRLIASCTLCGLCGRVCPKGIDIGMLARDFRHFRRVAGKYPPAYSDFFLRDMEFSDTEAAICLPALTSASASAPAPAPAPAPAATLTAASMDGHRREWMFFPGCMLAAARPEYVTRAYRALGEGGAIVMRCCGAPADYAGDAATCAASADRIRESWVAYGRPVAICACAACMRHFRRFLPEMPVISLYEALAENAADAEAFTVRGEADAEEHADADYEQSPEPPLRTGLLRFARNDGECAEFVRSQMLPPRIEADTEARALAENADAGMYADADAVADANAGSGRPRRTPLRADVGASIGSRDGPVDAGARRVAVFDPCAARDFPAMQEAVRSLARAAGLELHELPYSGELAQCCGTGAHTLGANPKLASVMTANRARESDLPYLCYCVNCRDAFAGQGKQAVHILDVVLELPEDYVRPTLDALRENRLEAKRRLLAEAGGVDADVETDAGADTDTAGMPSTTPLRANAPAPAPALRLDISPALAEKTRRLLLLEREICETVRYCEETRVKVWDGARGLFIGHRRAGLTTIWVEYRATVGAGFVFARAGADRPDDPPEDGAPGFALVNVYVHRIEIQGEDAGANARVDASAGAMNCAPTSTDADTQVGASAAARAPSATPLCCVRCGVALEMAKARFAYLGHEMVSEVPRCPKCGQVCLSEALVNERMHAIEGSLEDK